MGEWKTRIQRDLCNLGLVAGDHLLVHASLKSLGSFPDRAATVVSALLEILGSRGTLLLPALSYQTVTPENPFFDILDTPSCVGGLPEFFRGYPGVSRSMHPTHSVCAVGKLSDYLLSEHWLDDTPCGPHSPFSKLPEVNGKILFLGCGTRPNTSMHAVEEKTVPPYLFGPTVTYSLRDWAGTGYEKKYRTHGFSGVAQRYERVLECMHPSGFRQGKVLQADSVLMDAESLWEAGTRQLAKNPLFFVAWKDS